MRYDETVLIKLRRDYSKDETVLHLINVVKESKVEIGKLTSYIAELKHDNYFKSIEIKTLKNKSVNNSLCIKIKNTEQSIEKIKKESERIKLQNSELRKSIKVLKNTF